MAWRPPPPSLQTSSSTCSKHHHLMNPKNTTTTTMSTTSLPLLLVHTTTLATTPSAPSLQDFRGMAPILGKQPMYGGDGGGGGDEVNGCGGGGANDDELSDDGSQAGEKKRRLNVEQVRTLEKNFVLGNNLKLSPEPKMQLARWLQNHRARLKTKQLEKDYDALKAANDVLLSHNKKLQAKIMEEHKNHGNRYAKRSETAENEKGAAAGGQSGQSASTVTLSDARGSLSRRD